MKQINLRTQLVLWTVLLEAALLIVFALVLVGVIQEGQDQQIEETLRLAATELNAVIDFDNGRYSVSAEETAALRSRGVIAWVFDTDGQLVMMIGDADELPLPSQLPTSNQIADANVGEDETLRLLVAPLAEADDSYGQLILGISLHDTLETLREIQLGLAIAIPIVLLLSAGGGLFLAGRALKPVDSMVLTAQQISADDLSQRINLAPADDEIGRLAATFNAMLDRLEEAFQRERQFTSDVSHELRTPLGILKTQLSLARSRPRGAAELLAMMADMEGDVDRMTRLTEQMLALAHIEHNERMEFHPVNLVTLLAAVVAQLEPVAAAGGSTLGLEVASPAPLIISGHEELLGQVFSNLIENGIKYTAAGGWITVRARRVRHTVEVTVADTGTGIAAAHLPHLFERFYRVDDARTRESGGFGLGLAISQAIVAAHGGTITAVSKMGLGTTITVNVPAKPAAKSRGEPVKQTSLNR